MDSGTAIGIAADEAPDLVVTEDRDFPGRPGMLVRLHDGSEEVRLILPPLELKEGPVIGLHTPSTEEIAAEREEWLAQLEQARAHLGG